MFSSLYHERDRRGRKEEACRNWRFLCYMERLSPDGHWYLQKQPDSYEGANMLRLVVLSQESPTSGISCLVIWAEAHVIIIKCTINIMLLIHPQTISHPICGNMSSMKPVPGAEKVGDRSCSSRLGSTVRYTWWWCWGKGGSMPSPASPPCTC